MLAFFHKVSWRELSLAVAISSFVKCCPFYSSFEYLFYLGFIKGFELTWLLKGGFLLVISGSWGSEAGIRRQTHALTFPYSLACHPNTPIRAENSLTSRSINLFNSCSPFIPKPQTSKPAPKQARTTKTWKILPERETYPRIVVSLST